MAPPPPPPAAEPVLARHRKSALTGIGLLHRKARESARAAADQAALAELKQLAVEGSRLHTAHQAELDEHWQALLANDEGIVLATLATVFEDNDAAAAAIGVEASEVALVVLVPPTEAIPERKPTATAAGNLSLKKLTKREAGDFYRLLVCGYALVTVKEAFAAAPGLSGARVIAIRNAGSDAYGQPRIEVLMAAHLTRAALQGVQWHAADASQILDDASTDLQLHQVGPSKELAPLALDAEPDLARILGTLDLDELVPDARS